MDQEVRNWLHATLAVILMIVVGLALWVGSDPTVNVPVISPIVCSLKGGVWISQPNVLLGVMPGCYEE